MIKNIAFIVLVTLRVFYQPANDNKSITPFAKPSPLPPSSTSFIPAKVTSINGDISNNKVILQWVVSENEYAAQFEVEKSTNGKNFILAALVFGTDKTTTDNYQFYEKVVNKKVVYRIKIINKDQSVDYSTPVEIKAKA